MIKLIIIKKTDIILNKAKEDYENKKQRLREQARNKYRKLSNKDKNIKIEYGGNRYQNMSEEEETKRIPNQLS